MSIREKHERRAATEATTRLRKNSSSRQDVIDLCMECEDETLSPAQIQAYNKALEQHQAAVQKIKELKAAVNARVAQDNKKTIVVTPAAPSAIVPSQPAVAPSTPTTMVSAKNLQSLLGSPRVVLPMPQTPQFFIQNTLPVPTIQPNTGYKLLLDARTGLIIGTVPNDQALITPTSTALQNPQQTIALVPAQLGVQTSTVITTTASTVTTLADGTKLLLTPSAMQQQPLLQQKPYTGMAVPLKLHIVNPGKGTSQLLNLNNTLSPPPSAAKSQVVNKEVVPAAVTTTSTATNSAANNSTASSNTSSSMAPLPPKFAAQHPSLMIKVVPQRQALLSVVQSKRNDLDKTIGAVLKSTMTGIVKWMFEHGLFHINQMCTMHRSNQMQLMFDPLNTTDRSGGYKWQCSICQEVLPIQHRSFFDSVGYSFVSMLRVIYCWACNEDVQKVLHETKVDANFLRSMYAILRSLCTNKTKTLIKLGGNEQRPVEVAIALLNMPCSNASTVFLGCVFERITGLVALRVLTNSVGGNVEDFLQDHVLPGSTVNISRDIRINPAFAKRNQYTIIPSSTVSYEPNCVIMNAMAYVKERAIPMLGATISQLRVETVQYFLNELMWREKFGTNPYNAFNNILLHIKQHYGTGTAMMKPGAFPVQMPVVTVVSQRPGAPSTTQSLADRPSQQIPSAGIKRKRSPSEDEPAPKKIVLLDDYYYAWQEGINFPPKKPALEEAGAQTEKMNAYKFKCHVCKKVLDNNIKLMRHLYGHIENRKQRNLDLSDVIQCKFCFREFETPYIMQCHVEDVHLKNSTSLTCRICDRAFKDKTSLVNHMYSTHTTCEMPYSCDVCKYRSSMYRNVIEHFQQEHTGTNYIQCHYCLRVFNVKCSPVQQVCLTNNFWIHIYKHQTKSLSRKCTACCLTFFGQIEMKQHRMNDHVSFKGKRGVSSFPPPVKEKEILMEAPSKDGVKYPKPRPLRTSSSNSSSRSAPVRQVLEPLTDLCILGVEGQRCLECKDEMECPEHFMSYVCCSLCRYATSCGKAFANHMIIHHSNRPRADWKSYAVPAYLPTLMYCVCGYSERRGNKMANHLIRCGKRSCYPSSQKAKSATLESQSASFPPLVVLDEDEEVAKSDPSKKWLHSFAAVASSLARDEPTVPVSKRQPVEEEKEKEVEQQQSKCEDDNTNMLNMLGLMRRPLGKKTDRIVADPKVTEVTKLSKSTDGVDTIVSHETGNGDNANASESGTVTTDTSFRRGSVDKKQANNSSSTDDEKNISKEPTDDKVVTACDSEDNVDSVQTSPQSDTVVDKMEEVDEDTTQVLSDEEEEEESAAAATGSTPAKSPAAGKKRRRRRRVYSTNKVTKYTRLMKAYLESSSEADDRGVGTTGLNTTVSEKRQPRKTVKTEPKEPTTSESDQQSNTTKRETRRQLREKAIAANGQLRTICGKALSSLKDLEANVSTSEETLAEAISSKATDSTDDALNGDVRVKDEPPPHADSYND